MNLRLLILMLLISLNLDSFSQADSLKLGDKYWEDQLYMSISYDIMRSQPQGAETSGFSYSLSVGYIKDIPFTKQGDFSAGIGLGYGYNSFNHDLQLTDESTIQLGSDISTNKLRLHNIEFPIQLRWRTSDAVTYSFWRVYAGVKLNYNLSNKFSYQLNSNNQTIEFSNVPIFNKFQSGFELSAGYGAFNFYMYYGLSPVYKNATINGETVSSKITKFGLIFYLL
jgi:hypothetical protein